MQVQWYPGHMTKAKRIMLEDIKLIDLVIELIDSRVPLSSRNPDIDEIAKGKSRLVLLNKSDLADPCKNEEWIDYFNKKDMIALLVDSKSRNGFSPINKSIEEACKAKIERNRQRGIINRPVRAMVVGIPNVGKSTFINSMCKKASAKTGNKPGVTKGKQWINLNKNVELLDTPGILWPRFDDEKTGMHLAFIGSINDEIIDETQLAMELMEYLVKLYPGALYKRYEVDESQKTDVILNDIAIKRGCLKKGNEPDYSKASNIILDDFRSGRLGRITFEEPVYSERK
ncbi:MAG: ribosome biogenesis GTPase YlqF [Lachnospiraceae bacterium]|nr:ribosome biogenesis GTPase YlqF [Lachnospiraceae bacterium]